MENRLSASPSSRLPSVSKDEGLEFSIFLSGIKTGLGAGCWEPGAGGKLCCVCFIYQVKLSESLNQCCW